MNQEDATQWLVDIEKIKQLKHRYCSYCDQQYDSDRLAELFTEKAIWDGGRFGRADGREGIRQYFAEMSKQVRFANHYVSNPLIEIEGDYASGCWDLWQPMVTEPHGAAFWLIAKYQDRYKRVGGDWFFAHLELDVVAFSPYEYGFGKQLFPVARKEKVKDTGDQVKRDE